jgi:predicted HicB family RNase H-like nuclease
VNGKFYIGVHGTSKIEDGYLGSGLFILRAIKKYGRENFKREVLFSFTDPNEAFRKESELVVVGHQSYNLSPGGLGGVGKKLTPEHRRKISEGCKNPSLETRRRIGESAKARYSEEDLKRLLEASKRYTKSDENRKRISKMWTGRTHSEETKRKISEAKTNPPEETRKKMREAKLGTTKSAETRRKMSESQKERQKRSRELKDLEVRSVIL